MYLLIYTLNSDCSRMCMNGGVLDEGNCTCDCAGGFSGPNCEGQCIGESQLYRNSAQLHNSNVLIQSYDLICVKLHD